MRIAVIVLACCLCVLGGRWYERRGRAAVRSAEAERRAAVQAPAQGAPATSLAAPGSAPPREAPAVAERRVLPPEHPASPPPPERDAFEALLDEVRRAQAGGLLDFEPMLVGQLYYSLAQSGRVGEARMLLERFRPPRADLYHDLAQRLRTQGRGDEALAVLALGTRALPDPSQLAGSYLAFDPRRSVALLRAKLAAAEEGDDLVEDRLALAGALRRSGERREAVDVLRGLLDEGVDKPQAFALLSELDPEGAERALRRALAQDDPDEWLTFQLARTLGRLERAEEGFLLLEQSHRFGADPDGALDEMVSSFPEQAFDYLGQVPGPASAHDHAYLWTQIGDGLSEHDDPQRACEAWLRGLALSPIGLRDEALAVLADRNPDALLASLRAWTVNGAPDELDEHWGDLGDAAWHTGDRALALSSWEQARSLDPEDDEWIAKLQAAAEGRDPLE